MTGPLTIDVRGADLVRVGEIDDFKKLTVIPRFQRGGAWELTLNPDPDVAQALSAPGAGIVLTRNGQTLMSGPAVTSTLSFSAAASSDAAGSRSLVVSGIDDTAELFRRLCMPDPTVVDQNAATIATDDRSGLAESVMKAYVNANAGPGAIPSRRMAGLVVAPDLGRGALVSESARFDKLLDLETALAIAGGLGFRVVQVGAQLVFDVFAPRDRSGAAVFSDQIGNLQAYQLVTTRPTGNADLVAGGGEGADRVLVQVTDDDSIGQYGLFETFADRRDTSDLGVLAQQGATDVSATAATASLSLTPIDVPGVTYGVDYDLGDTVLVEASGVTFSNVVRELTLTYTPERGEEIVPTVGAVGATGTGAALLFAQVRDALSRLSGLERRT